MTRATKIPRAVVLGGSVAGLFAARALSDHAERVTLIERDELPNQPVHRKGTPQSHHANNLVPGALPHLERWFPGITKEFADDGATRVGSSHDARGFVFDGDDSISGVRVHAEGEGPEEVIPSDFVVDAMGRGTKARGWLEKAGYPPPPSTETRIRVRYATRLFRRRGDDLDGDKMAVVGATAGCARPTGSRPGTTRGP